MIEYIYFEVKPIYMETNELKSKLMVKTVSQLQNERTYTPGCAKL